MNKKELAYFEKLLRAQRQKLLVRVAERSSELRSGIEIVDPWNYAEAGADTLEEDINAHRYEAEYEELRGIDEALERIQTGIYGICQATGKLISRSRLEALPTARYCREYQERLERMGQLAGSGV